jgi:hypothetical protein
MNTILTPTVITQLNTVTNPNNALLQDDVFATYPTGGTLPGLVGSSLAGTLPPAGSQIVGLEVEVWARGPNPQIDLVNDIVVPPASISQGGGTTAWTGISLDNILVASDGNTARYPGGVPTGNIVTIDFGLAELSTCNSDGVSAVLKADSARNVTWQLWINGVQDSTGSWSLTTSYQTFTAQLSSSTISAASINSLQLKIVPGPSLGAFDLDFVSFQYDRLASGTTQRISVDLGIASNTGLNNGTGGLNVRVANVNTKYVIGGPTYDFGHTWSVSDFSDLRIIVQRGRLSGEDSTVIREVDHFRVVVYYNPPGGYGTVAERESVKQKILYGVETTPGTGVATSKRLRGLAINPTPNPEFKHWRPQGEKLESNHLLTKEWSAGSLSGIPCYDEIGVLLTSGMCVPNSSGGVADVLNEHVFRFDNRADQLPKTLSVQYGDEASRVHRVTNFGFPEFGIEFNRGDANITGNGIGRAIEDNFTQSDGVNDVQTETVTATGGTRKLSLGGKKTSALAFGASAATIQTACDTAWGSNVVVVTGTGPYVYTFSGVNATPGTLQPTIVVDGTLLTGGTSTIVHTTPGGWTSMSLIPILPGHVNVYLADTYASLSSNKMTRATMLNFNFSDRFKPFWTLNQALGTSYAGHIEVPMVAKFTLKAHAMSEVMALLGTVRSDAKKFVRLECLGPIIGVTSDVHKLIIDACVKVSNVGPMEDDDGVYEATYELSSTEDTAWGNSVVAILNNGVVGSSYTS